MEEDKVEEGDISPHVQIIREACLMLECSMKVCVSSVECLRILLPYCEQDSGDKTKATSRMYRQSSFPILYCGCIFLSTKTGEEFKRVRDVINVIWYIVRRNEIILEEEGKFGVKHTDKDYSDNTSLYKYMPQFHLIDYTNVKDNIFNIDPKIKFKFFLKDAVFKVEQHLLRLISFDFQIISAHCYSAAINFVLKLFAKRPGSSNKNFCIAMVNDIFLIGKEKWRRALEDSIEQEQLFCDVLSNYAQQFIQS